MPRIKALLGRRSKQDTTAKAVKIVGDQILPAGICGLGFTSIRTGGDPKQSILRDF